jgi:hypothetical protein
MQAAGRKHCQRANGRHQYENAFCGRCGPSASGRDGEPSRFHPDGFAGAEVRRVRDIIASQPVIRLDRPALIR